MAGIRQEIRDQFRHGDALTKLILVNLGVFLLYYLVRIAGVLFTVPLDAYFVEWTALPSNLMRFATRPWTLITYMFLHQGFLHILFNMLILFFTGRLFMEYLGGRRLLSMYLIGGIAGGLLYIIFYNIFPAFKDVLDISNNRGASAGVMAVMIAIATYVPRFPVKLFFVLNMELRWVAVLLLVMDLINLGDGNNMGGHLAHLGGAAFGYFSIRELKHSGRDWTEGFSKMMDKLVALFKPRPKIRKVYSKNGSNSTRTKTPSPRKQDRSASQQRMDEILDKISRSGYESLSKEEKDYLFKIGKDQ